MCRVNALSCSRQIHEFLCLIPAQLVREISPCSGFADGEESDDEHGANHHRDVCADDEDVEYVYAEEGDHAGEGEAADEDEEEVDEDETEMFKMFTDVKDALNPLNMIEKATGKKVFCPHIY